MTISTAGHRTFVPTYIDGNITEYCPLVLTLKVFQPHQSSSRPSGCDFHDNNAARSARANESDQVNPPMTGEGMKNAPHTCLTSWITPKRRRFALPLLIYLLGHQFDTFGENLKVIVDFFIISIFVTSLCADSGRKVLNVWKFRQKSSLRANCK